MLTTADLAMYLWGLAGAIVIMVIWQYVSRKHEILSLRNAYLAGFVLFQLVSASAPLSENHYPFSVYKPVSTGLTFCLMSTVFVVVFLLTYHYGRLAPAVAARVPQPGAVPTATSMLELALVAAMVGLVARLGIELPLVSSLTRLLGAGLAAASAGLVGWVWSRYALNPIILALGAIVVAMALFTVLSETFGRRGLVAVFGALIMGFYFGRWRHMGKLRSLQKILVASVAPIVFIALFTSVRSSHEMDRSAGEQIQQMRTGGDVADGIEKLTGGQETGGVALWAIENHPAPLEYRHLFTLRYFFVYPVPRSWWPEKPLPLSNLTVRLAHSRFSATNVKLPGGVIGNAGAEGGWYALLIYAIITGPFIRFFDELISNAPHNPLVVLPVVAPIGQILGLARGEVAAFAFNYVFTGTATLVVLALISSALRQVAVRLQ